MRCKKAEKLIIDSTETILEPKTKNDLENHITNCQKCSAFKEDFHKIRLGVNKIQILKPSDQLSNLMIELCHNELIRSDAPHAWLTMNSVPMTTPRWILGALVGLTVLTIVALLPILGIFLIDNSSSTYLFLFAIIVFQNIITLFFAPILFRLKTLKHISENCILNGVQI